MNDTLIWLFGMPVAIGLAIWFFLHKSNPSVWIPSSVFTVLGCAVLALVFFLSKNSATSDTEIWNGAVTGKTRDHGTYERPYDCNCRMVQSCSGSGKDRSCTTSQKCDTCYETRYTVQWNCQTTLGTFRISKEDQSTRRVYNLPNPARWESIQVGDPVSKTNTYTNYIQAVPNSLFTPSSGALRAQFASLIPSYPLNVYDLYRIDRFLTPGYSTPDAPLWNADISKMLSTLGPKKQVNAIVVIAKTSDPNYEYALRDAWEGANKNDVVLLIGSAEWPKIDFVRAISWTKNELFKVQLRDSIQELGTIQREQVMSILASQIDKNFERRRMREFEYLQSEIDPPGWLIGITSGFIAVSGFVLYGVLSGLFSTRRKFRPRIS